MQSTLNRPRDALADMLADVYVFLLRRKEEAQTEAPQTASVVEAVAVCGWTVPPPKAGEHG